jgi:hypothetical protein
MCWPVGAEAQWTDTLIAPNMVINASKTATAGLYIPSVAVILSNARF